MHWISLLSWLVLCFAVAWGGSRWTTAEIPGWYKTLARPAIAPPNWIFAPVWTLLYVLMAIAAWLVTQSAPTPQRNLAIALFLVQLALNLAWSWFFFRRHTLGTALAEVVLLWAAIGACTLLFRTVSPLAAGLMLPYWAWVSFASLLNEEFWRLNRETIG
jgi:tryptophan-rich sensory protein